MLKTTEAEETKAKVTELFRRIIDERNARKPGWQARVADLQSDISHLNNSPAPRVNSSWSLRPRTVLEKVLAIMLIVAALVIVNQHLALKRSWNNERSLSQTINSLHQKWP